MTAEVSLNFQCQLLPLLPARSLITRVENEEEGFFAHCRIALLQFIRSRVKCNVRFRDFTVTNFGFYLRHIFWTISIVERVFRGGNVSDKKDKWFQVRNSTLKQGQSPTKSLKLLRLDNASVNWYVNEEGETPLTCDIHVNIRHCCRPVIRYGNSYCLIKIYWKITGKLSRDTSHFQTSKFLCS